MYSDDGLPAEAGSLKWGHQRSGRDSIPRRRPPAGADRRFLPCEVREVLRARLPRF